MSLENKYMSVNQFLRKLSGLEKEVLIVDHNYVKAWNNHPDSQRTKPAHLLFMKGLQRYPLSDVNVIDQEVDIETCDEPVPSPFDNQKTRVLPNECERNLRNTQLFRETEQDYLDLSKFSSFQRKLYQQVLNVLQGDRLSKLCNLGSANEPMKRRLSLDTAAKRIRQIFGLIFWDMELLSWLHKTFLNNLEVSTLSIYIDVLQTLKIKVPILVDRILQSCAGSTVGDAIIQIFKKSWDPVVPVLNQNKPKKLLGNPIILICPSAPNQSNAHSPRLRFWGNNLSCMCKVMNLPANLEGGRNISSAEDCLQFMMTCIRNKVAELKNHYPNRPLILLGWTIGALIACHIALQEPVDGVICLGFPLTGVNGSRGDLNDPLLDNKVPTLFVVGQNARMCSTDDIEDFRSRMRAETGLVVVGGGDDLLRMCPAKLKFECVTQSIVDRCIIDEIGEFLSSVVVKLPSSTPIANPTSKPCTPIKEDPAEDLWVPEEEGKRRRRKPREYSPELSPVRKRQKSYHISRQSTSSAKARSPSSSETSSSGDIANEKASSSKSDKKSSKKRMGRPTSGTWHKRTPGRPPLTNPLTSDIHNKIPLLMDDEPSKTSTEIKPVLPFSKNILPKKNEPVDVEKAFGFDSSFLPRPLTPQEPEDTVSAEETERALAELDAMSDSSPVNPKAGPSTSTPNANWLGDALLDTSFVPVTEVEKETTNTIPVTVSISHPNATTSGEAKMTVSLALTPALQSVLAQGKMITTNSLQSLKTSGGISLLTNTPVSPAKTTIITVPSASAASLIVTNAGLRTQSGKMFQLLTKSSTKAEPSQPCNLSLLSDVAGMSEQAGSSKKPDSGATLVKLATSDKASPFQSMKCLKVIKAVRTPSPPTRVETAEEMVEKQLAIQALNKSIGIESSSNLVKESGYSICYAKADGSIVSRSVTRPNFSGLVSLPHSNRGRGRPPFNNRPFRFSNK